MTELASALFQPQRIALIGASGDVKKNTARPQRYLRKHGFNGSIAPVNPNRGEVLGEKAYASIGAIPYSVDHAYIMVPTNAVENALCECAEAKIPVVTIFSDGFAETGDEGLQRQEILVSIARKRNIRLLGPNSMGVINPAAHLALSVNAALELPELIAGSVALVSQSGSLLGTILSRGQGRGIGFSKLISVGNECDLGVGEVVDLLVDDAQTETMLLFLETVRDAKRLGHAARRAFEAGKPVIVYKLGRSTAGIRLALSHTGAIAGDDRAADAYFRHHGMLRVDYLETLLELPLLARRYHPRAQANGVLSRQNQANGVLSRQNTENSVAVLTTTGGGAAMVVDRLGLSNIEVVPTPDSVIACLARLGLPLSRGLITDLTMAGARAEIYTAALNALLQAPECDLVIAVVGSSGQFHPELAIKPIVAALTPDKPLLVFIAPEATQTLNLLREHDIAGFRTPEACADAVRAYLDWSAPAQFPAPTASFTFGNANRIERALDEQQAAAIFSCLGIAQAQTQTIRGIEDLDHISLSYPLAAKILSPDIAHKSDAGAVVLRIQDRQTLQSAVSEMLRRVQNNLPQARIRGILLQKMESGLLEVLIGYRRSPLGPTITLAMGGLLAEIYADAATRMAPVDLQIAHTMLKEVKALALLRGYRNQPRGDVDALAQALCAISQLAYDDAVAEAEINPLIVKHDGQGVVAVDGLIIAAK